MPRKPALLLLWTIAVVPGCSRQDTDGLARIGRKLADRASVWSADARDQLDLGGGNSPQARVTQRLRWDAKLADLAIEVKARGAEIELSGIVPNHLLKVRAVELAESTAGVERIVDSIQVLDPNPAPVPAPKDAN